MEFKILGPLEAREGDRVLACKGAKQRLLLGVLLLHANEVVSSDRLAEALWGERPPATGSKALQMHVSELRDLLEPDRARGRPGRILVTRPPGYELRVEAGQLDLQRFEHAVGEARAAARAGLPRQAADGLREALALRRGPALADLGFEDFLQSDIARLDELRLAALEDRIDADLALGRHADLPAELESLVGRHPLRERLRAQLMLALYRSGRQAEALEVYQDARRALTDELGIEPGRELQELQQAVLRHDPALDRRSEAEPETARFARPGREPAYRRAEAARAGRPPELETRYAVSGAVRVAYQVVGGGPRDLVVVPGFASHLELTWEYPPYERFVRRLATFARVILFDKRGTGLSDPIGDAETLEERMDDIRAVMDAVGSQRADLFGWSEGAMIATVFGASRPDRVSALVLYGSCARTTPAEGYPWAPAREGRELWLQEDDEERYWGTGLTLSAVAPSRFEDRAFVRWWGRFERQSMSPKIMRASLRLSMELDVRAALPSVRVPTLLLHRTGDPLPVEGARWMAGQIPGARLIELPGDDHWPWLSDPDEIIDEVEEFLTGERRDREPDRALATVLFTDIVGSTERATELGDRHWRDLLEQHDRLVRRELERCHGREVKTTGDGLLATFDGPGRGINCAQAICARVPALGIEVRAGLHTGECELRNGDVGGIAVHIGARVAGLARPGEVLVSSTVKDLVVGSGLVFADRGNHSLKGAPGEWHLYAVAG
jgi:DNA-binding SARP family transcriptional activator/pimeloyl-ACP methyl ester carboxylesterase